MCILEWFRSCFGPGKHVSEAIFSSGGPAGQHETLYFETIQHFNHICSFCEEHNAFILLQIRQNVKYKLEIAGKALKRSKTRDFLGSPPQAPKKLGYFGDPEYRLLRIPPLFYDRSTMRGVFLIKIPLIMNSSGIECCGRDCG